MKTILTLSVLFCCSCLSIRAQQLDVVADVVQFRGSDVSTQWELQYSFSDTTLRYVVAPTGFVGEMLCSLVVRRDTAIVAQDVWIAAAESNSSAPLHSRYYAGIRTLNLEPGTYTVSFDAADVNNAARKSSAGFTTQVPGIATRAAMSDIMFVMPKDTVLSSRFMRAGQPCDPNPRHELLGTAPTLALYAEFYNAKLTGLDTAYAEIAIFNNVREEEFTTYIPISATSNLLAVREEFLLENLRTGVYALRIRYLAKDKVKVLDSREERFFILNPAQPPEQQKLITEDEDFQASEWSVTTGDRLKLELELCEVLATKSEIEIKNQCTDERSQQRFLYRFWRSRDTDETTPSNERLDEFRKMYQWAQTYYTSPTYKDGWRSDRGTIMLKYGRPTQIEQFIQNTDTKPYEIWFYQHIQGGAYFYFVDITLQQNLKLVHSTVIGNVNQPNWFNLFAKAYEPNPNPSNKLRPNQR
ncbi:MAG: GWxTD domain-containing protein [Ignavibacteria bacterium]|jgi:GWxTD domain-containing protein